MRVLRHLRLSGKGARSSEERGGDSWRALPGDFILPWAVLGVGCALIGILLPLLYRPSPSSHFLASEAKGYSPWRKELVGKRILLPGRDLQGQAIEKGRSYYAFSLTESCCLSGEGLVKEVSQARLLPVVVIVSGDWKRFPRELLTRKDLFRVVSFREAQVPKEMSRPRLRWFFFLPKASFRRFLRRKN